MEFVLSPVLHKRLPIAVADNSDVPLQLFTTVTAGAAGISFGEDTPTPASLVQPSTVVTTV